MRNMQKALLYALVSPNKRFKELQDTNQFTELMAMQEEMKTIPSVMCGITSVRRTMFLSREIGSGK